MQSNGVILGGTQQSCLSEDLVANYPVKYIAGGAAQNAARVAQWVFGDDNQGKSCFIGSVGDDKFAKLMEIRAKVDGVDVNYVVDKDFGTGTCAVLNTDQGMKRSLVSFLGAAKTFGKENLIENWPLVERANVLYSSGFPITSSFDAVLEMAKHCSENEGKLFTFNLSAPYICENFMEYLWQLLPYIDVLFANETEGVTFAKVNNWEVIKSITKLINSIRLFLGDEDSEYCKDDSK